METDVAGSGSPLTPQDLLAGSLLVHEVSVPSAVLHPGQARGDGVVGHVRLRPLKVATLALISRAASDDAALVPLLMLKESLVEPVMTLDQVRHLHAGLVQFLVSAINRISGLEAEGGPVREASGSAIGTAHLLLARHYGWTPAQVAELTPGQVAVYLSGIEPLPGEDAAGSPP